MRNVSAAYNYTHLIETWLSVLPVRQMATWNLPMFSMTAQDAEWKSIMAFLCGITWKHVNVYLMTLEVDVNIQHEVVTTKTLINLKRAGQILLKVISMFEEKSAGLSVLAELTWIMGIPHKIVVSQSVSQCKIFIYNIPKPLFTILHYEIYIR